MAKMDDPFGFSEGASQAMDTYFDFQKKVHIGISVRRN